MIPAFEKPVMVTQATLPKIEEYIEGIRPIWESHWLTNNGAIHNQLESELKAYLKTPELTLFTNGHLALDTAVKALELKGEVITTPFTFVSTTHAIKMNGLTPVFCDIKMSDYTIDEDKIEALITEKTSAIMPVHVYGYPCNTEKIQKIADKYGLKVIYDAAHAFGIEVDGTPISRFGDMSMFSFHATKVFNTIEGGALVYGDASFKHKLDLLKNFGIEDAENISTVALNAKMNEFQAAMGLLNLKHIDESISNRKKVYEAYKEKLSKIDGIILNEIDDKVKYNYAYMPVLIDETKFLKTRDQLHDALIKYNVFTRKYFYPLITDTKAYNGEWNVPIAEYVSKRILCLPIYSDLLASQAEAICDIIAEIYES